MTTHDRIARPLAESAICRSRIALSAESFGFGPVSKVCAVANELKRIGFTNIVAYAEDIAAEFFKLQGIEVRSLDCLYDGRDVAIVGLSPVIARRYKQCDIPVFYIDSLAFMWNSTYWETEIPNGTVTEYWCQNVFNSVPKVRAAAPWLPLVSVDPITRKFPSRIKQPADDSVIVNLGGFSNPFDSESSIVYARLIAPLIETLAKQVRLRVLASQTTRGMMNFPTDVLKHESALTLFQSADAVFTSPGLTTLLELAQLDIDPIILPPQNLSQLNILRHLSDMTPNHGLLERIIALYPIQQFAHESEGVAFVREINASLVKTGAISSIYADVLDHPRDYFLTLGIADRFNGASQCARRLVTWLKTR